MKEISEEKEKEGNGELSQSINIHTHRLREVRNVDEATMATPLAQARALVRARREIRALVLARDHRGEDRHHGGACGCYAYLIIIIIIIIIITSSSKKNVNIKDMFE